MSLCSLRYGCSFENGSQSGKPGSKAYSSPDPQDTGSFKERGARYALLNLSEEKKKNGVFAASAGNHALALSLHGKQLGIDIKVVMPKIAPLMKINRCQDLGAKVLVQGADIAESREIALRMAQEQGGIYINGYDHYDILAGAGTVGLEILDQVEKPDAVIVPVGGCGLIAGVATAVKTLSPNTEVIGVVSETCQAIIVSLFHPESSSESRTSEFRSPSKPATLSTLQPSQRWLMDWLFRRLESMHLLH